MFGKKKTVEQQLKQQDRDLKRTNRGLERDRNQLDKEEKKLELEIKKAAKSGNRQACNILAKQLVGLRKQKTRSYAAGSRITAVGFQAKAMHSNVKVANAMGKTSKTMTAVNKQLKPQDVAKTMQQFEMENAKMEMSEEMINDTLEDCFADSDEELEENSIINQVLDEIGVDMSAKVSSAATPSKHNPAASPEDAITDAEIERQLAALGVPTH